MQRIGHLLIKGNAFTNKQGSLFTKNAFRTMVNLKSTNLISKPGFDLNEKLQEKIAKKDAEIKAAHHHLREKYPENIEASTARKKRLIWRSKQRGWLEVDM